jgi:chromosome segregation ATPase
MVAKISDFEREISMQNDCNMKIGKDIERIKGAIRNKVRMISHHDHNREDLRVNLEKVMQSVDDTENKIRLATVENNKLEKMISLLAVHMEILTQKVSALTATEDEINQQIRIKSQIGSDLKQNLQECSKRLTDISNLHSILRKERDIIVAARLASSAKIANMEKDISDAKSALESALTDFEQKTIILAKHQESHVIGRILRSSLQGEKTESSLKLREKIEETKMQHRRLENLRLTLFTLQREISLQKSRNQNVSKEKEALSKKLAETMSAIYRSNQRARLRDRNCKELEISIRQRRDDVRLLILKVNDNYPWSYSRVSYF